MKINLSQATKEVLFLIKKRNNDIPMETIIITLLKLGMNTLLREHLKISKDGDVYK